MVIETIRNLVSDKEPTPNKFTIAMGELIKKAREESGLNQTDLALKIYRRRATLSDIENGKTEVSSGTLVLLSAALQKPITYFYPTFVNKVLNAEELSPLEQELIKLFQNIWSDHLRKIAIVQVRTLSEFDPIKMIDDHWIEINAIREQREEMESHLANRRKKK